MHYSVFLSHNQLHFLILATRIRRQKKKIIENKLRCDFIKESTFIFNIPHTNTGLSDMGNRKQNLMC